jgi:hypothetical protein
LWNWCNIERGEKEGRVTLLEGLGNILGENSAGGRMRHKDNSADDKKDTID